MQAENGEIVASQTATFSSALHRPMSYWGFDVLLDRPVSLDKGKRFSIEASISGPRSFSGRYGKASV